MRVWKIYIYIFFLKSHHRASNPKNKPRGKNRLKFGNGFHVNVVFRFVVCRLFPDTLKDLQIRKRQPKIAWSSHYLNDSRKGKSLL